jgi:hypothetical protein
MNRVQLEILGLSYSQTQAGAYVLLLAERNGLRKLPIIIGSHEAQSIAMEIEKMTPNRPVTYDLVRMLVQSFEIKLIDVLIDEFNEGVFHTKMMFEQDGKVVIIDSRTSDAIGIAIRLRAPIFALEHVMESAGIMMEEREFIEGTQEESLSEQASTQPSDSFSNYTKEQLQELLDKALEAEDYEKASDIRDELNKRNGSN